MKKIGLIAALSFFSVSAFAEANCDQLISLSLEQAEQCVASSEKAVTDTYEKLIVEFKGLENGSDGHLEESQRAWVSMRTANCQIVNLNVPTNEDFGTNAARAGLICKVLMNKDRNDFLSNFL